MLLVEGNTLLIRNPARNKDKPYQPPALTDADKAAIDSQLMGRGLHCEFGFEPINLNTGNFYLEQEDSSVPDYGEALSITRSYNSRGAEARSVKPLWAAESIGAELAVVRHTLTGSRQAFRKGIPAHALRSCHWSTIIS